MAPDRRFSAGQAALAQTFGGQPVAFGLLVRLHCAVIIAVRRAALSLQVSPPRLILRLASRSVQCGRGGRSRTRLRTSANERNHLQSGRHERERQGKGSGARVLPTNDTRLPDSLPGDAIVVSMETQDVSHIDPTPVRYRGFAPPITSTRRPHPGAPTPPARTRTKTLRARATMMS